MRKPGRYANPKRNEWVQPIPRGYLWQCCDCGLVHSMDFQVRDGRARFRVRRAVRETARVRAARGIEINHD